MNQWGWGGGGCCAPSSVQVCYHTPSTLKHVLSSHSCGPGVLIGLPGSSAEGPSGGCNPGASPGWALFKGWTGEGPTARTPHMVGGLHCLLAVTCHMGLSNMWTNLTTSKPAMKSAEVSLCSLPTDVTSSTSTAFCRQKLPGQPVLKGVGSRSGGSLGACLPDKVNHSMLACRFCQASTLLVNDCGGQRLAGAL